MDAAQRHFDKGDLAAVSSRELAAEVGVSHTLVNYHFGSRDGLIAAAIALRAAPHDVIALARDRDGVLDLSRLAQGLLAVWEHPEHGARLADFARRLVTDEGSADAISEYLQHSVFQPLVDDFGREHARRIGVAIVGFLFGRYVLTLPMFTAPSRDEAGRLLLSMIR
jgi:AcrR family transcriptional regulator